MKPRVERVLLGVAGGIGAYKAADLASRLTRQGAAVRVIMTRAATAFVSPLTFQGLTHQEVLHQQLATDGETGVALHLAWARWEIGRASCRERV
jgi:phosphopantothenoylcysteine decarboxylase / phosphopantothenate---cysteine ligase